MAVPFESKPIGEGTPSDLQPPVLGERRFLSYVNRFARFARFDKVASNISYQHIDGSVLVSLDSPASR